MSWKGRILRFLAAKNFFWKARQKSNHALFYGKRATFTLRQKWKKRKEKLLISFHFFRTTFLSVSKAFVVSVCIFTVEYWLRGIGLKSWNHLPDWIKVIYANVPLIEYKDGKNDVLLYLLSSIIGFCGVILGLFYPLLATIASTAYAKVSSGIRSLLTEEPKSQRFVQMVAFTIVLGVLTLASMLVRIEPQFLMVGFILFTSLRVLYTLLSIGMGIFGFFDPATLMRTAAAKFIEVTVQATIRGTHWQYLGLQMEYHNQADQRLQQMRVLVGLSSDEKYLRTTSMVDTLNILMECMKIYQQQKVTIPANSEWFEKTYQYQSWFLASHTEKELAQSTESQLQPKVIAKHNWIEERIIKITIDAVDDLEKNNQIDTMGTVLSNFGKTAESLGFVADMDTASLLLSRLQTINFRLFNRFDKEAAKFIGDVWDIKEFTPVRETMAALESSLRILHSIQIGWFKKIESLTTSKFDQTIKAIDWKNSSAPFEATLLPQLHKTLQGIQSKIAFEIKVEGNIVTPDWFIVQTAATAYMIVVNETFTAIFRMTELSIVETCTYFRKKKYLLPTAFMAQLGIEHCWLLQRHIESVGRIAEGFEQLRKQKENTWMPLEIEVWKKKIQTLRQKYVDVLLEILPALVLTRWDEDMPDFFGKSYYIIADTLNQAMYDDNEELFKKFFKPFFAAAMDGFDVVQSHLREKRYQDEIQIKAQNQFIMDILDISGIAYVYSELYQKPIYRDYCCKLWDNFLEFHETNEVKATITSEKAALDLFIAHYQYFQSQYNMGWNFDRANNRERLLAQKFEELGFTDENYRRTSPFSPRSKPTKSIPPLLRMISPRSMSSFHYKMADIFVELYIQCRVAGGNKLHDAHKRALFNKMERYAEEQKEWYLV
jgi:hypothetical protein